MTAQEIVTLRKDLNLSQVEFAQLFGGHFMTVSKWERGLTQPTAYQEALMRQFQARAEATKTEAAEEVKKLLVGAGVVAALAWLLTMK
ncbi:helix-turn-helix domain-containing protein [Ralstonia solanacearum]|uniref:helix-turn-helix domain-containing protein n=1 Tax=Ralstonia solanacearum TaxID=305 RepID=UPI000F60D4BF|nr:helix-turn-helix domain-containing protein [Ralstonia solanacearum]